MSAMTKLGRIAGLVALMVAAGSVSASAQEEQERPKPSLEKQIGDWTVVCYDQNGSSFCHMSETLVNKKTGMRVLGIGMRYFPAQKASAVEVTVPLNVGLENGASISVGKYTTKTLEYALCVREGCQAISPVDGNMLKAFGGADKGKVNVVDYASGKKVAISFELKGFADAYQTMVSSSKAAAN